jgi:CDP-4-dehydro-6-deoxyglucose reductase
MSHKVHVEPSGREFVVEAGESVLAGALRQGVMLPYSCRGGTCGSCRGRLLSGEVDYPDGLPEALSEQERARGEALFCQAIPRGDLRIEAQELARVQDIEVKTLPVRVVAKEQLAHDVLRLYLRPPTHERLRFLAGQYIDFLLRDGRRRAFSLANAPHDDELLELHVRHVRKGSFTEFLFHDLKEKAILRIQGPFGQFYFREESRRPVILMAGGTGFAPIKGMLEHAFAEGVRRPLHLYWGVRARCDLYLDDLPRRWEKEHANFSYTPVLSEPLPEDDWHGRTGLVHDAILADYPDLSDHDLYASGPPVMVEAGTHRFPSHGLDLAHYYSDAFEYAKDVPPAQAQGA